MKACETCPAAAGSDHCDEHAPTPAPGNPYEAKQERRRERLEARAARLRRAAAGREAGARQIADMIPLGQPILIGHHSEKADRRRRGRMVAGFEKAMELRREADEAARKAAAVGGNGAISSDDPETIEKLGDKVLAALVKAGTITEKEAMRHAHTFALMPYHKVPFPSYALTNIGARVRQAKARAEHRERRDAAPVRPPFEGPGFVAEEDRDENRLVVTFPSKPARVVIQGLKMHGFRWTPSRGAWTRQLNNAAWFAVEMLAREMQPAPESAQG